MVDGLTQISDAAEKHDYARGLGLVQWIVQKANFSEVSSFLPGIKNLLQIGAQLKVWVGFTGEQLRFYFRFFTPGFLFSTLSLIRRQSISHVVHVLFRFKNVQFFLI